MSILRRLCMLARHWRYTGNCFINWYEVYYTPSVHEQNLVFFDELNVYKQQGRHR